MFLEGEVYGIFNRCLKLATLFFISCKLPFKVFKRRLFIKRACLYWYPDRRTRLYPKVITGTVQLKDELEKAVIDFNSMPNGQLFGLTPNEVLAGAIPSSGSFKEQIHFGHLERMQENRSFNCRKNCHD
jgi:hypothetical protein